MFTAFFQEDQDIGNHDVLVALAAELGLDAGKFRGALQTGRYREAHRRALEHADHEARITSVPTFVIGDQVLHGLQAKEDIEAAIERAG